MYLPSPFRVDDFDRLAGFIEAHSFATLISHDGTAPFATHLPLLFDRARGQFGTLVGHVARGNAQWRHFERGGEVLAIFHGPHAYVSPSWYETELAVPTWNYAAVHAYGTPRLLDDAALDAQLRAMIAKYESGLAAPWPGDLPDDYRTKMRQGIVGFEIEITRLEGKFKLSQNRSEVDRQNVIAALEASPREDDRRVAEMMKEGEIGR